MHSSKERTPGPCGSAYCFKSTFSLKILKFFQSNSTTDYSGYHLKNARPTSIFGDSKTGKLEVFRRNSKEVLCGKVPTPYKKAHKTI